MCKVYAGYHGTSEIEHGLCACTVDNPLAKARGLSLPTDAQTMLYFNYLYQKMQNLGTHGLSACTGNNPLAKARGISPRTDGQMV